MLAISSTQRAPRIPNLGRTARIPRESAIGCSGKPVADPVCNAAMAKTTL
jgi:hypothetical protein